MKQLEPVQILLQLHCPFCNTMLTDGVKNAEKEDSVKVMDIAGISCSEFSLIFAA